MNNTTAKSISKEQALAKLTKEGYRAVLEKNILYVLYNTQEEYLKLSGTIKDHLREMGYNESFGIKAFAEKSAQANLNMDWAGSDRED